MSRIGKKHIPVPQGVSVELQGKNITVTGKLGVEVLTLTGEIDIQLDNNVITLINRADPEDKKNNALHGLYRSLLANMVVGVSSGFEKNMEIVGVGYRVTQQSKDMVFQLGYSHNIVFSAPEGITLEVVDNTRFKVKGINKERVGQVAANIRELRPPEPYKGKGIRYAGEQVRKKAGKTGKK